MSKVCCNCKHNIRTGKAPNIECHCEIDGSYIGYVQYARIIAWMPLPEPYKEEAENEVN